jgi:hypothetical protein
VYSWSTDVNWPIDAQPGQRFSQILVKYCAGSVTPFPASDLIENFTLQMPDSSTYSSEHIGYNSNEIIGFNQTLHPGDCVKGVIIFQTPKKKPRHVVFDTGGGQTFKWSV